MREIFRGGRGMAVGQSERVNMLTSYQDLLSRPKEQSKYVLECERFNSVEPFGVLHYGRNDGGRVRQMLLIIFCVLFSWSLVSPAFGQEAKGLTQTVLKGVVSSLQDSKPIEGASVTVDKKHARTDKEGRFTISVDKPTGVLTIKHIGYKEQRVAYENTSTILTIALQANENQIEEVEVVSTGYQKIPKERATGSFEFIDNKQLNKRVGATIIDRLENASVSMTFPKDYQWEDRAYYTNSNTTNKIKLRGTSTMIGEATPTIVVDNVIYEGDLRNINPNDIENITVLKDAVATSIWGTRAGQGMIVITTKKGKFGANDRVSVNTNVTVNDKPNLFALPEMSTTDFIEYERFLFDNGYYNRDLNDRVSYPTLSPVVLLLDDVRAGRLTMDQANVRIDSLKGKDLRRDYIDHVYRRAVNTQTSVSLSGGKDQYAYLLSVGDDRNRNQLVTSAYKRNTFRGSLQLRPLKRLEISTDVTYANVQADNNSVNSPIAYGTENAGRGSSVWPYQRLVDKDGQPIAVDMVTLRSSFRDTAGRGNLLDWSYRPLAELKDNYNKVNVQDLLFNFGLNYKLAEGIDVQLGYMYQNSKQDVEDWQGLGSFSARNTINTVTRWNDEGVISMAYPIGDILFNSFERRRVNMGRLMANLNRQLNSSFRIDGLIGSEMKQIQRDNNGHQLYGVNMKNYSHQKVNYNTIAPILNQKSGGILLEDNVYLEGFVNRYVSFYGNANLSLKDKYIVSLSARQDASNLFGVKANNKWNPLWSAGASWMLHQEDFLKSVPSISYLKLRATYGYAGRALTSVSSLPLIYYSGNDGTTGYPYASITSPANQDLRWERTKTINLALDARIFKDRISINLDWYRRHAMDLITTGPVDPTSGYDVTNLNGGYLLGKGFETQLSVANIRNSAFKWTTSVLMSKNRTTVKRYHYKWKYASDYILNSGSASSRYLEGYDVGAVFAYKSAGLDPEKGNPTGYLDGIESQDYRGIRMGSMDNIRYMGTGVPVWYGNMNNEFDYKGFTFSFNIQSRLGHRFFRSTFSDLGFAQYRYRHKDYADRWQQPGDELVTTVPSLQYPLDSYRHDFYNKSEDLVVRGDNIRLQDVYFSYMFKKTPYVKGLTIYGFAKNINGILWRANDLGIDPEYRDAIPYPLSVSVGIKAEL